MLQDATSRNANAVPDSVRDAWVLLEQSGWLARRSPEVRELLYPIAQLREFAPDDVLYRAGDEPNGVFGLVGGTLEAAVPRADGQECLFHRAEAGFWVGDLALFAGQRRLVTLRAASQCTVLYMPQIELSSIIDQHPELSRDFYELSHSNMRTVLQLLGNMSIPHADNRIAIRLLMHAGTLGEALSWMNLSRDTLAQMVAVSPRTVRRSLIRLQKLGLIEVGYAKLRITDHERLARFCGYSGPD